MVHDHEASFLQYVIALNSSILQLTWVDYANLRCAFVCISKNTVGSLQRLLLYT